MTREQVEHIRDLATRPGTLEFALLANQVDHARQIAAAMSDELRDDDDSVAWVPVGAGKEVHYDGRYDVYRESEQGVREFLIVRDPPGMRITGDHLEWAGVGFNQHGTPGLDFKFNHRGAFLFQQLTATNAPRPGAGFRSRLAIILDGELHSAPTINEMIGGGRGQITGLFSEAEVRQLAAALNGGVLPERVEFVESADVVGAGGE